MHIISNLAEAWIIAVLSITDFTSLFVVALILTRTHEFAEHNSLTT